MRSHLLAGGLVALSACLAPVETPEPQPLRFWVALDADPASFPDSVQTLDHPCGMTADVSAMSTVPPLPGLEGEIAAEIDASGAAIRIWPVPVDYSIIGVSGDRLILSTFGGTPLAVATDGTFRLEPGFEEMERRLVPCPDQAVISGSDYVRCTVLGRQPERILVYEGPCT